MSIYFLENKYTNTYYRIVSRAQTREKPNTYTEKHHIIPKSLGGSNSKDNLAILTAREHFICHHLLTKMLTDPESKRKMIFAFYFMCHKSRLTKGRYKPTARLFESIKIKRSESMKGSKLSPETRAKISDANTGKRGRIPWNKGVSYPRNVPVPKEHLQIMTIKAHQTPNAPWKKQHTCTVCNKTGYGNYMLTYHFDNCKGPDYKTSRELVELNRKRPIIKCPHCNKTGGGSSMKRWHFDNCKSISKVITQ
jgi:NUMOD3 motif